jgi:hypothetical protein
LTIKQQKPKQKELKWKHFDEGIIREAPQPHSASLEEYVATHGPFIELPSPLSGVAKLYMKQDTDAVNNASFMLSIETCAVIYNILLYTKEQLKGFGVSHPFITWPVLDLFWEKTPFVSPFYFIPVNNKYLPPLRPRDDTTPYDRRGEQF